MKTIHNSDRFASNMFIKLQGFDGDWQNPMELVYRLLPS
jgi:hypothetical protein